MNTHSLKTHLQPFKDILEGKKKADIRLNDRNFKVGDILCLEEYNEFLQQYTGREIMAKITHIQEGYGLRDGAYVMLSISRMIKQLNIFNT